eukprot:CAMPEP_0171677270 /NCGR_PEP_ID=MMETSP0990-20121206/54956_1 /TAXON_ID=483369 /ORGANISM="non described non described, Strain CCMP2098" /LENGTH=145 /DNA_ID=CAMNT_0012263661 /DNA_START=307 /DNA_END=740 /DNA_ORIENTATION=+
MPTSTAGRVRVRLCTAFCSVGSVEDFFGEHVPERHHEPAFHLPNVHCGVQTLTKVHVDVAAKDLHLPRQAVHLHFGHPHALAEVVERAPVVRRRFVEPTRGAQTQPFTRRRFRHDERTLVLNPPPPGSPPSTSAIPRALAEVERA